MIKKNVEVAKSNSTYFSPVLFLSLLLIVTSTYVYSQQNLAVAQKNFESSSRIGNLIPEKFWGQYYKESKKECNNQEFAFEHLLTISESRVSFGYIVSCVPSIVYRNGGAILIKAFCRSEAGSASKITIKIKKKESEITVDNEVYKQC
jgi:hypothetical protein